MDFGGICVKNAYFCSYNLCSMGFFKSLFSSPQSVETQTPEEVSAEKKRIAFETLRDSGIRAMNIKEYKLAADYFQKALELNPDDSETKALLAEAYMNSGEMEKALELLRPLAEENPDNPKIRISIAQAALQLKDWDEVLAVSAEAEHLNPENPSVYYFEGMAYNGMEDYDNAVAKFSQAIALANDYAAAIVMRARCYAAQEKFEEAEKDIDQLINNNQADDYVFIQKGNLCKAREDYENAADAYRKALEINPFNVEAYILEAETYEIMGNDAKALAVYNEGVDYMPGVADLLRARAAHKEKNGDNAGAEADRKEAEKYSAPQDAKENGEEFTQMQNRVEDNMRKANPFGL